MKIEDKQMHLLLQQIDMAKKTLSNSESASLEVDCFHGEDDFSCGLSRDRFEDLFAS